MVKKLTTKAEFARMADITAGMVTKLTKSTIAGAMDGKRIDLNHPSVVEYLNNRDEVQTEEPAHGIDPLYDDVVIWVHEQDRPTIAGIQKHFKIGYNRAARIKKIIETAGADKKPPPPKPGNKITKKAAAQASLNDRINSGTIIHEVPEDIEAFADMTLREIIQRFGTDTAFLDWLNATKRIEDINEKRIKNAEKRGDLVSRNLIQVGVMDIFDSMFTKMLTDGAKTIARRVHAMASAERAVEDCEKFVADQIGSFIRPAKTKSVKALKNA